MAVQIDIPRLYIDEIPPRGAPPTPAAFGAIGFAGKFPEGDVNTLVRCSSMEQVYQNFGSLCIGSAALDYLYWMFAEQAERVYVVRVQGTASSVTLQDQNATPEDRLKVEAKVDGTWGDYAAGPPKTGIQVKVEAGTQSGTDKLTFTYWYSVKGVQKSYVETYDNLSYDKTEDRYWLTIVNAESKLVKLADLNDSLTDQLAEGEFDLTSGAEPNYEGTGEPKEGFDLLDTVDEISFYGCDTQDDTVRSQMITHALTCGDRQVRVDPPKGSTFAEIEAIGDGLDLERVALMGPWTQAMCPIRKARVDFPPSGFYLGVNARLLPEESTTNKQIVSAVGSELDMTRADIYSLQQHTVSPIAPWGVRGIRIRNNLTTSSNPNLKYQSRRSMTDWISETIEENFGWAIGELNTEDLRLALKESLDKWFSDLKTQGRIEDYYVKCDEDNNPPELRETHKLYVYVAVRLLAAADYIIFQVDISETTITATESEAA